MLHSIEIEGYRGFKKYRLANLRRVNLLVGKNNCGKTSVLEALHLLASGGDPRVLLSNASQRGEVILAEDDRERRPREPVWADLSHFFHGHDFAIGSGFTLRSSDGFGAISVTVIDPADKDAGQKLFPGLTTTYGIQFRGGRHEENSRPLPVSQEGAFLVEPAFSPFRPYRSFFDESARVQFITPEPLDTASMAGMWNKIGKENQETEVVQALRILDPSVVDVFFESGERPAWAGRRAGVLVGFKGAKQRLPLGSYGEGMRRLLAFSLSLIRTAGGVLLIDEIDTGLHHSIMGNMWRLVVDAARKSDVQVFATTHSFDCLRGLSWLCENHPDLGNEVSVQKIVPTLEEAVAIDANGIQIAMTQDIDLR